jgi:hypothetical protein
MEDSNLYEFALYNILDRSDPHIYFKIVVQIRCRRKEQICIMSFYNDCITEKNQ